MYWLLVRLAGLRRILSHTPLLPSQLNFSLLFDDHMQLTWQTQKQADLPPCYHDADDDGNGDRTNGTFSSIYQINSSICVEKQKNKIKEDRGQCEQGLTDNLMTLRLINGDQLLHLPKSTGQVDHACPVEAPLSFSLWLWCRRHLWRDQRAGPWGAADSLEPLGTDHPIHTETAITMGREGGGCEGVQLLAGSTLVTNDKMMCNNKSAESQRRPSQTHIVHRFLGGKKAVWANAPNCMKVSQCSYSGYGFHLSVNQEIMCLDFVCKRFNAV